MRSGFLLLPLLVACNKDEETFSPSIDLLSPADSAEVETGTVGVSLVVADFELTTAPTTARGPGPAPGARLLEAISPIPVAFAHNEGQPAGFVELRLDDVVVAQITAVQFSLQGVAAGPHVLEAELFYEDGDSLGVSDTVSFTAADPD